jgi:hypothetical protein
MTLVSDLTFSGIRAIVLETLQKASSTLDPNNCEKVRLTYDHSPIIFEILHLVIVTYIWQKLSSVERKVTLTVTNI